MTTTVFITPCWKSSPHRGPEWLGRLAVRGWAWLAACLVLSAALMGAGAARAQGSDISAMRLERTPEGLLLSAQVRFELPPAVDEALLKGIPMFFVADAVLLRDRWYWTDQEVAGASRHMRLSYQPLTRRWRVVVGSSPIGHTGLALGQTYESRDEALAAIQRISGWKIAEPGDMESDQRYTVNLRFRLDVSQLPRPFQISLVGQTEWNLVVARTQRVDALK